MSGLGTVAKSPTPLPNHACSHSALFFFRGGPVGGLARLVRGPVGFGHFDRFARMSRSMPPPQLTQRRSMTGLSVWSRSVDVV